MPVRQTPKVAVIGPCTSGKSTVAAALRAHGVDAVGVAQEHTLIPDLYRHVGPDVLVYLDVSYEQAVRRRRISWGPERLAAQRSFMTPARAAADLVILTDRLTPEEVVRRVLDYLERQGGSGSRRTSSR